MAEIFKNSIGKKIFLASTSPRRKELLLETGIFFSTLNPDCKETAPLPSEDPQQYCLRMATAKAESGHLFLGSDFFPEKDNAVVIGCDTIVCLDRLIFGKPKSFDALLDMLSILNGKAHDVYTAVCLASNHCCFSSFIEKTVVQFGDWPEAVIRAYASACRPIDKAGGYGIQDGGGFLVKAIAGSWSNVVGLPLTQVLKELLRLGFIEPCYLSNTDGNDF